MNKKLLVISFAGAVLLGGAVAAGAANTDTKMNSANKIESSQDLITVEEAQKIALSKADGQIESIEIERENGKKYYDIDIENGQVEYDIHIDALTGKIISTDEDWDDEDGKDDNQMDGKNIISTKKAIEIAEKEVNGTVKEIEKDEDDGNVIYDIQLRTSQGKTEVDIDASTGKVLKVEIDD